MIEFVEMLYLEQLLQSSLAKESSSTIIKIYGGKALENWFASLSIGNKISIFPVVGCFFWWFFYYAQYLVEYCFHERRVLL